MALNSNNTKINDNLTAKVQSITVVDLYRSKEAFQSLFRIVEDIIESPNKAHHRDYWTHISEFEKAQNKMSTWTLKNKIDYLKGKKLNFKLNKLNSKKKNKGN